MPVLYIWLLLCWLYLSLFNLQEDRPMEKWCWYPVDYFSCLSKLYNNVHHARHQIRARPLLHRFRVLVFGFISQPLKTSSHGWVCSLISFYLMCFRWNISYVSTRVGYSQIPINISVNSCEGRPKKEVQGGIGTQKLPVPKETWPQCGRDCNVWGSMPQNSNSWLPIRNWWWNVQKNGEFFRNNSLPQYCHLSPMKTVCLCLCWNASSFLEAIIHTQTLTHSVSLVCRHVCMLGGAGCLVKLLCFCFLCTNV